MRVYELLRDLSVGGHVIPRESMMVVQGGIENHWRVRCLTPGGHLYFEFTGPNPLSMAAVELTDIPPEDFYAAVRRAT